MSANQNMYQVLQNIPKAPALSVKGFQFFSNCMIYMTNNKPFDLGLTAINKVRKHIYYIPGNIFVFFYRLDLRFEALTGYKNKT